MKMKKAMAGVFAGIVAVSAMATSAISVNAAETTQTERKASVSFDSASTSWVFSAKGTMINGSEWVTIKAHTEAAYHTYADAASIAAGRNVADMTENALLKIKFPTQIEDLKIVFTGKKKDDNSKTLTQTVTPKQKSSSDWACYTIGVGAPNQSGKSANQLNLNEFDLTSDIEYRVTGKVYNRTEYRDADSANASVAKSIKFYTSDEDYGDYTTDYGVTWSLDNTTDSTKYGSSTLYSSALNLTAEISRDKTTTPTVSEDIALALMQGVFGTGRLDKPAVIGDKVNSIQSEYMDVTTNDYRTLTKDSKPYETSETGTIYKASGRYEKAKGLAFEDLKANLTRYVVDIVGNSKGSTMTFNMVKAPKSPFDSSSNNLDDFGWNWADNVKQFSIGINNQRTSAIQMQAEGSGNSDNQIEISWDKLVERSGLAVNALGLVDDIFIASNDPEFHIASLDVYRPANTFEDLSAGEPTVDSEDTLSSVDTTVATSEAPVVTAPAVDTTAAPATTPTVTPNPGTGNAPIALAVIPVAIAAAAIIAKKRK